MNNSYFCNDCCNIKEYAKVKLYNSIVELTNDDERINYDAIDAVINYSFDLICSVYWSQAINFVKKDLIKENKEKKNEISDVLR